MIQIFYDLKMKFITLMIIFDLIWIMDYVLMPKINIYSRCICNSGKIYKYCCSLIIYEPEFCEKCDMIIECDKCYVCERRERLNDFASLSKKNLVNTISIKK